MEANIPLTPLHPDEKLILLKLEQYSQLTTEMLIQSLKPGTEGSLKVRPDGTILDGHHRIKILRDRGLDVNLLPREVIPKHPLPDTID
jgi:hypothetical protein